MKDVLNTWNPYPQATHMALKELSGFASMSPVWCWVQQKVSCQITVVPKHHATSTRQTKPTSITPCKLCALLLHQPTLALAGGAEMRRYWKGVLCRTQE